MEDQGGPQGYGGRMNPRNGRDNNQGRDVGPAQRNPERVLGKGIYNLSHVQFSNDELKVLDLGLKFAPDKSLDKFEVYIDLHKFMRKLNTKKTFCIECR